MFSWSVRRVFALVSASLLLLLAPAGVASAQGPPQVSWVATNPGGLATSAGAVAWSQTGAIVATGLLDRWMRVRSVSDGHEIAILQPHRSGGVVNLTFSTDGKYLAVGNQSGTGTFSGYDKSPRAHPLPGWKAANRSDQQGHDHRPADLGRLARADPEQCRHLAGSRPTVR